MTMRAPAVARILFLVTLALVTVVLVVPNSVLDFLRAEYGWLGAFANGIDRLHVGLDLDHIIAFAVLGCTAGAALPRARIMSLGFVVALLAAASEVAQFWVPGRTPRVSDAAADVAGAILGIMATRLLLARRAREGNGSLERRAAPTGGVSADILEKEELE